MFDKTTASQSWKISSRLLREYIEYFSPKTEQLDFMAKDGKAIFTSFTEKVMDGKEILKQPLETAISLNTSDFEDFHAEEGVHITISVKDFRAIVTHAETLKGSMTANFSRPSRPLQFFYQAVGMTCQFILMTRGDSSTPSATPNASRMASTRPGSRQSSGQASIAPITMSRQPTLTPAPSLNEVLSTTRKSPVTSRQTTVRDAAPSLQATGMGPPPKPVTISTLRDRRLLNARSRAPSQATTASADDSESLFMPRYDEEERQWDPPNFEEEEEQEERLGWDANADIVRFSVSYAVLVMLTWSFSLANSLPFAIRAVMHQVPLARRIWVIQRVCRLRRDCRK